MEKTFLIFIIYLFFTSCEKNPGEGGSSAIEGKVIYFTTSYNTQTQQNDTHFYPKSNKDVYIIYSGDENEMYDDNFETDWQGRYRFDFLRKGEYTIFTYVDSIVVNEVTYDYPIFQKIEVKNNDVYILPDFIIQR